MCSTKIRAKMSMNRKTPIPKLREKKMKNVKIHAKKYTYKENNFKNPLQKQNKTQKDTKQAKKFINITSTRIRKTYR